MSRSGGASTSSGGANSNANHGFTADELEVSEILLSLPRLIYSTVRWATKKKRSSIKSRPSLDRRLLLRLPSPGSLKSMAKSPTTTLDFPVESDEKSRTIFKRKRREELLEEIDGLQKRQKVDTEALRAKRLEFLGLLFNPQLPESESPEVISLKSSAPFASGDDHQQIQSEIQEDELTTGLGSPTAAVSPCPISQVGPILPWAVGCHHPNNSCPTEIPDLNLSADEPSQPLDRVLDVRYCRAQCAAVARRGCL